MHLELLMAQAIYQSFFRDALISHSPSAAKETPYVWNRRYRSSRLPRIQSIIPGMSLAPRQQLLQERVQPNSMDLSSKSQESIVMLARCPNLIFQGDSVADASKYWPLKNKI